MYGRSIVFVAVIALASCQPPAPATPHDDGRYEAAPDWSLADADGRIVKLSEKIREAPQLVLFWATWCPYCRALMPHIQSVVMEYNGNIGVLAVNIMEDGEPATYLEKAGLDFTLLPEGEKVAELFGIQGTPGLLLVDTDGNIRFDLNKVPELAVGEDGEKLSHRLRSQRLAPYWAAELRKAIDQTMDGS